MKIRNIGLMGGLITGSVIMGMGLALISQGDTKPGGNGLMLILGWLVFIPGAVIAIITFVSWLFTSLYSYLSSKNRRIFWLVIFISLIGIIGAMKVNAYLQSQPEVIARKAMEKQVEAEAKAIQMASEREVANEKFKSMQRLILGNWTYQDHILVFEEQGKTHYNYGGGEIYSGSWSLDQASTPPYDVYLKMVDVNGNWEAYVLQIDAAHLTYAGFTYRGQNLQDLIKIRYKRVDSAVQELKQP